MADKHEPYAFLEDRPTLWPHQAVEKFLPADIDSRLTQAIGQVLVDRDRAIDLAEQAVALARTSGDPSILARSLYRAAGVVCYARRPARAYVLCLEAQALLERMDDRWRATKVLQMRGRCCLSVGEHERAQALVAEAAARFEKMADRTELARCHTLMAMALRLGGELERAVEFAARGVATLPDGEQPQLQRRLRYTEALVRLHLGRQHAAHGDGAAARAEYARAFAALPDVHAVDVSRWAPTGANLLDTAASVAMVHGDDATARAALHKLAAWARQWKSPLERGLAWMRLTEYRQHQGRRAGAIACAQRAVRHLSRVAGDPNLATAQMLLADLLEAAGDLKGAYEAFCSATRAESEQQREAIATRAELLALDLEAEQELRKTEQTLAYGQRLSNVGHLVASVNHELNQPMASIRMLAETAIELIKRGEHAEVQGNIRSMLKLSARLKDMATKQTAFPAQSESQVCSVRLADAVDEALATLRSRLVQTPCEIMLDLPPVSVRAQEAQLVRVIANLVNNALDVIAHCDVRRIAFACEVADGVATLSVADSGPGLSDAVRERLFQPFFSTKPAGQGLGLGLALSRDVMREMAGNLSARNGAEGGAVFDIRLPLA
jgi:C4-dicarboxylate-specific signal transduction histidine kinase